MNCKTHTSDILAWLSSVWRETAPWQRLCWRSWTLAANFTQCRAASRVAMSSGIEHLISWLCYNSFYHQVHSHQPEDNSSGEDNGAQFYYDCLSRIILLSVFPDVVLNSNSPFHILIWQWTWTVSHNWLQNDTDNDDDDNDAGHHSGLVSDTQHSHLSAGGGGDNLSSQEESPSQGWVRHSYSGSFRGVMIYLSKTICRNQGEEWVIRH